MKKFLLALILGAMTIGLVACAELPDGVDQGFHDKAMAIFAEVDDDTMELDWEGTDADDQANVDQVSILADSERELAFSEALDKMVELQPAVIKGDREALKQYLQVRRDAMNALNLGDQAESDKFQVTPFNFGEEE